MEYTDLDVWKETRALVLQLYVVTKQFPEEERYGLASQIKKSAISVPSNIAEGCGRRTSADTLYFLHIARGSLYEVETQLYLASDLKYIKEEQFTKTMKKVVDCKKLLNGFINYFKKNDR